MQTFLPYPNFAQSAKCLDNRRLGKQRSEVLSLLKALTGEKKGWVNHPCTKMWRGYEKCLVIYGMEVCREWVDRGFKDSCSEKIRVYRDKSGLIIPMWLGDEKFHASHRAALLAKDFKWYSQFGWTETPRIEYIWPIK